MDNLMTLHIYYNGKSKQERHFKISQTNYETWILYHAFWNACGIEIYRPTFEISGLNITYKNIEDYCKAEKWLNEHKEVQ